MKLLVTTFVLLVICTGSASADSDGYFCSSPAFLAYEFSFSKEPSDQHKLYVIHFGAEPRNEPQWLRIPSFQVHAMKCFSDRVEIVGWERRYVYSVSSNAVTARLEELLLTPGKLPEGFSPAIENLGSFSQVTRGAMPSTYTYPLATNHGKYEIRIVRRETANPCRPFVRTSLVKSGQGNNHAAVLTLYAGTAIVECGE